MADISWLAGEYVARKAAAEARVTGWVPYSDSAFEPEPLYELRHRCPAGSPVEDATDAIYTYGLDEDGRAWVEQQAVEFDGQFYECFRALSPAGDVTELALYDYSPEKNPIRHQTFTYADGLLVESAYQALGGCGRLRCFYEDGRLVRLEEEHGDSPEKLRPFARYVVEYDEHGQISMLIWSSGEPGDGDGEAEEAGEVVYRKWPSDMTLNQVEDAFLDAFVEVLPTAVAADPPPVRPACAWLQYPPGQFNVLPPMLLLPLEEGEAGIARMLDDARYHEIVLDGEQHSKLHELAGLLDQIPLDDDRLQALVSRAAARLNEVDWPSLLPVPGDFFVFGCDIDQENLENALDESVGEDRANSIIEALDF